MIKTITTTTNKKESNQKRAQNNKINDKWNAVNKNHISP